MSAVSKKYIMALSGLVLVLFVFVHMAGNLLFFVGAERFNLYAHYLQYGLPGGRASLWAARCLLLLAVGSHAWVGIALALDNRKARGEPYEVYRPRVRTLSARSMAISGSLLIAFIVFHILQFTLRVVPENYEKVLPLITLNINGQAVEAFNVYAMVVRALAVPWMALFYILAVAALGLHLSHGASSLFQSLGLRSEKARAWLDGAAQVYGWLIFLGFASVPLYILLAV